MQKLEYHQSWSSLQHESSSLSIGSCQLNIFLMVMHVTTGRQTLPHVTEIGCVRETTDGGAICSPQTVQVMALHLKLSLVSWLEIALCIIKCSMLVESDPFTRTILPLGWILWTKYLSSLFAVPLPPSSSSRETRYELCSEATLEEYATEQRNKQLTCTARCELVFLPCQTKAFTEVCQHSSAERGCDAVNLNIMGEDKNRQAGVSWRQPGQSNRQGNKMIVPHLLLKNTSGEISFLPLSPFLQRSVSTITSSATAPCPSAYSGSDYPVLASYWVAIM